MKNDITIEDIQNYIKEFHYWSDKRLNWWLKYPLYLPIGSLLENYWIRKMAKVNREFEKKLSTVSNLHN